MILSRASVLCIAVIGSLAVLAPVRAQAQWWRSAPADFEECADKAEKSRIKEEKTAALAECNAKFAGRRKPGGGYTYYDFMQDKTFDIAGPNPTPEEQKKIDEHYTAYLERERRSTIAAALMAKQQQQLQQVSLRTETEKVPVPVANPLKSQPVAGDVRPRFKPGNCAKGSFSCEWPRLSEGISDIKKLFGSSPNKGQAELDGSARAQNAPIVDAANATRRPSRCRQPPRPDDQHVSGLAADQKSPVSRCKIERMSVRDRIGPDWPAQL